MLGALFRGVFILVVVGWYSSGVWKGMNKYYDEQFKQYLDTEMEKNPRMKDHIAGSRYLPPDPKENFLPAKEQIKMQEPKLEPPKLSVSEFEQQLAVMSEMSTNKFSEERQVDAEDVDDQGVCSINPEEPVFGDGNQPCD